MTLAMMASAKGLAERISDRRTQVVTETGFTEFFRGSFLGIPVLVWLLALVFAVGWLVLNRTTFGRRTYAIGGNAEAARLSGINVKRHTALVYGISGLCCGIAAIMVVARTTSGASTNGLFRTRRHRGRRHRRHPALGGRGSLLGTLVGVLIFTVLNSIFTQNNPTPTSEHRQGRGSSSSPCCCRTPPGNARTRARAPPRPCGSRRSLPDPAIKTSGSKP